MSFVLSRALALGAVAPLLLAPPTALAQARAARIDPAKLATLPAFVDGVMAQQIATRDVAGAVVTVVHNGRVVFTRGYGFADVDKGVAVDGQRTVFRPGSVSKLFTWVALMQQVEAGRVSLDADINTYLDYKIPPFEGKPIRVRDLLSHSPGMSDIGGIAVDDVGKLMPYRQWMQRNVAKRMWAPGTETSYSNYGAALAGYIVEQVSGEPFAAYVEKHLFAPLGMKTSTFREPLPAAMRPYMATGYRLTDGKYVARPFELYSNIMPAGSGSATAPDMARFMLAMLGNGTLGGARILKPESVRLLFSNSRANAPRLAGIAHGFIVARDAGPRLIGHGGNTADFHSNLVLAPELGFGFFVSTTGGPGSYGARTELSDAIIGRMFPQTPAMRATESEPPPPVGSYRSNRRDYARTPNPDNDLKVSIAGNLVTTETAGRKTAWERIGPKLYEQVTGARAGGPYDRLEFYGTAADPRLSFGSQPHVTYHHVKP